MKLYLVNADSDYFLSSFFSMNRSERLKMINHIERRGQDNFILDSGAFSIFSGAKIDNAFLKKYIDRYCEFVNYYKIKNYIEMDIDKIIGYDEVKKINDYIYSRVGRRPLYVHHSDTRTFDDYITACKSNDYVFFGGLVKEKKSKEFINSVVNEAYSLSTKVHLLGFTPPHLDKIKHLYSCDSSSWSMGGRSGSVFVFKNNKISSFVMKTKRRIGSYELNNHNLNQWIKYQSYLKNKGWITE